MINPTHTATERAKMFRANAGKIGLRLTEERVQLNKMRAERADAPELRRMERIVELDSLLVQQLERMAEGYQEIAKGTL